MARRRKSIKLQRYERPAYRWSDDLDVWIGGLALVVGLCAVIAQANGVSIIPNP